MRVLITGVCGFVGAVLARGVRELRPGWEIVGLDNLVRPGSETNRAGLRQFGVRVVHGDIRQPSDLEALPRCDWILDAAANPSVLAGVDGRTSSRQLIEHNLLGTINLLEIARAWQSGVLILSTSRVYSIRDLAAIPVEAQGERFAPRAGAVIPGLSAAGVTEGFSTAAPVSLYGATKLASETLALEYGETYNLPVRISRCGVLAGARQFGRVDQGIFSYWIHSWARRRPLKYIGFDGTGRQVRDCLHARDLLPLLLAQIERPLDSAPRVLNVGGGMESSASLRELSTWCQDRFGACPVAAEPARRLFDVPWLVMDATAAGRHWNWKPQISLEQTWSEIAEHAEENPHWLDLVDGD
jgi:CDP-paratose 2-epimerase